MSPAAAAGSPWRSPVLWLVAGLPLLVVVATVVTLQLASRDRSDSSRADVRKIAQIQLEDLAPDRVAEQRGFAAALVADPDRGTLQVIPNEHLGAADGVVLQMLHPLNASLDRRVSLRAHDGLWSAQTQRFDAQAWQLRLGSERDGWRLRGQLGRDQKRTELVPAVSADG